MKTSQVGALQVHTGTKVSCALGVKYLSVLVYHLGTVRLFSWVARAVSESFISSFISRGVHRSHALIWRELPGASWAPYCSLRLLDAAGGPSIEYERIAQTRTPGDNEERREPHDREPDGTGNQDGFSKACQIGQDLNRSTKHL